MPYVVAPAGPVTARPSMSHPPIEMPPKVRAALLKYLAECPRAGVEALARELRGPLPGRLTDARWLNADPSLRVSCACPMLFPWWADRDFAAGRADLMPVINRYHDHETYRQIYFWIDDNEMEETLPRLLEVVEEFLSAAAKGAA
jgi:hypothetical protein